MIFLILHILLLILIGFGMYKDRAAAEAFAWTVLIVGSVIVVGTDLVNWLDVPEKPAITYRLPG